MITLDEGCDPLRAGFPFNGADPSYVGFGFLSPKGRAGDRARTGHLQLGRLSLYQMSYSRFKIVGEEGFEPPKAVPTDLQSAPFDRSGTPP